LGGVQATALINRVESGGLFMTKWILIVLVAAGGVLLFREHSVCAQATPLAQNLDGLQGFYDFSTIGTAELGTANSGECAVNGMVTAGLTDGAIRLDGHGNLTGSNLGISIGATDCSSPNFSFAGKYTVQKTDSGDKTIAATGMLTMTFQGRPAACFGTVLVNQPFTLVATIVGEDAKTFTIETSGVGTGSTYAEGPPPGPISCTAPILNFVTSGTGKRIGN
jgi:hypothetical protein